MKSLLAALCVLAIAATLWLWWGASSSEPSTAAAQVPAAPPASGSTRAEELDAVLPLDVGSADLREAAASVPTPTEAELEVETAQDPERFLWTGRITDPDGVPLSGVRVGLTQAELGTTDLHPDALTEAAHGDPQAVTDVEGRFTLEGPVLSKHWRSFWALPEQPYRLNYWERVWDQATPTDQWRQSPQPGEHDLGDIVLRPAGALGGRIVNEIGQPMANALIRLGQPWSRYEDADFGVLSGPDGGFTLNHLPAGQFTASAVLDGYVSAEVEPALIKLGELLDVGDLTLRAAIPMEGYITDQEGQPVANARVQAWGESASSRGETLSRDDGSFLVYVGQPIPHRYQVSAKGYRNYGALHSGELFHPEGPPARIELVPELRVTFVVRDARSGEPVERFGIAVEEGMGSANSERTWSSSTSVPTRDRKGGKYVRPAVPGFDQVVVKAPGYKTFQGDVAIDPGSADQMTLGLDPTVDGGWRLTGKLAFEEEPEAFASLKLHKLERPRAAMMLSFQNTDPELIEQFGWTVGRKERMDLESDTSGRFEARNPSAGFHRLFCDLDENCAASEVLQIKLGQSLDLGELQVGPWAALQGRVVMPAGMNATQLTLSLGGQERQVHTDSEGNFLLERLFPGEEHLAISSLTGVLIAPLPKQVTLRQGETTQLEWDLTASVSTTVELEIQRQGVPLPSCQVQLTPMGEFGIPLGSTTTNAQGRLTCEVPSGEDLSCAIRCMDLRWHPHPEARIQPGAGLQRVNFQFSAISIRAPQELTFGERDSISVGVYRGEQRMGWNPFISPPDPDADDLVAILGYMPAGKYRIAVEKRAYDQGSMESVEGTQAEFEIELVDGEDTVLSWADGMP